MNRFPTTCDIYLETSGKKVAAAQSYTAKPNAKGRFDIELTRVHATNEAIQDGIDVHELEDFDLVIRKPNRKIIYSGCRWSSIGETGALGSMGIDRMSITAKHREEATHD